MGMLTLGGGVHAGVIGGVALLVRSVEHSCKPRRQDGLVLDVHVCGIDRKD